MDFAGNESVPLGLRLEILLVSLHLNYS
jgi:hypothetical protein